MSLASRIEQMAPRLAELKQGDRFDTPALGQIQIAARDLLGAKVKIPSGRYRRLTNTALAYTLPANEEEAAASADPDGFIRDRLRDFFDFAAGNPNMLAKGNAQHWMAVGYVASSVATQIESLIGQDVTGGLQIVGGRELWHIHHAHGNPAVEAPSGQVAVGRDQAAAIPKVLARPDSVLRVEEGPEGEPRLEHHKRLPDGRYIYVVQVNRTHQVLRGVTMRIHVEGNRARARYAAKAAGNREQEEG